MNDLTAVQTALFGILTGAPATYPIYDAVPQSVAKPYIVIGEVTAEPDEELTLTNTDAEINLHAWSGNPPPAPKTTSKAEAFAMLQFIRARLDGQTISGSWTFTEEFNEVMEDEGSTASARIYHGIARYRVRVG